MCWQAVEGLMLVSWCRLKIMPLACGFTAVWSCSSLSGHSCVSLSLWGIWLLPWVCVCVWHHWMHHLQSMFGGFKQCTDTAESCSLQLGFGAAWKPTPGGTPALDLARHRHGLGHSTPEMLFRCKFSILLLKLHFLQGQMSLRMCFCVSACTTPWSAVVLSWAQKLPKFCRCLGSIFKLWLICFLLFSFLSGKWRWNVIISNEMIRAVWGGMLLNLWRDHCSCLLRYQSSSKSKWFHAVPWNQGVQGATSRWETRDKMSCLSVNWTDTQEQGN